VPGGAVAHPVWAVSVAGIKSMCVQEIRQVSAIAVTCALSKVTHELLLLAVVLALPQAKFGVEVACHDHRCCSIMALSHCRIQLVIEPAVFLRVFDSSLGSGSIDIYDANRRRFASRATVSPWRTMQPQHSDTIGNQLVVHDVVSERVTNEEAQPVAAICVVRFGFL